jgi:hypothetical protein
MEGGDWADPGALAIGIYLDGSDDPDRAEDGTPLTDDDFLVLVNGWWEPLDFTLPATRPDARWAVEIDTHDPGSQAGDRGVGDAVTIGPRSIVVLKSPRPALLRTDATLRSGKSEILSRTVAGHSLAAPGIARGGWRPDRDGRADSADAFALFVQIVAARCRRRNRARELAVLAAVLDARVRRMRAAAEEIRGRGLGRGSCLPLSGSQRTATTSRSMFCFGLTEVRRGQRVVVSVTRRQPGGNSRRRPAPGARSRPDARGR